MENYSEPPLRAEKTHEANLRATLHLKKSFGARKLSEVSADDIEFYLGAVFRIESGSKSRLVLSCARG